MNIPSNTLYNNEIKDFENRFFFVVFVRKYNYTNHKILKIDNIHVYVFLPQKLLFQNKK